MTNCSCVLDGTGDLDSYLRISSKLKFGILVDDFSIQLNISSPKSPESTQNADGTAPAKTGELHFYIVRPAYRIW